MIYGYHRISTKNQKIDRGIKEITDFCQSSGMELHKIYTDEISGKTFDRPKYTILRDDILRTGDVLIVTEVDRLGRDKNSTLEELRHFAAKGIRVMILEIPTTLQNMTGIDNTLAKMILETINNLLIEMYATFAQAETEKRQKRQREGIQAMKDRGEWTKYGRPVRMDIKAFEKQYQTVLSGEFKHRELMKKLGLSESTYYRYVRKLNKK